MHAARYSSGDGGSPLEILVVTHYAEMYGANRSLLDLLDGAGGRLVPLVLIPREGPLSEELRARGVDFRVIRFRPWYYEPHPHPLVSVSRKWRGWLAHHAVNVVMEQVAKKLPRSFDLVYTNSAITDFGHRLAQRLELPHVWHLREFGGPDYGIDFVTGFDRAVRTIRAADAVVTNSDAVRRYFFGQESDAVVIPNGVVRSSSVSPEARLHPSAGAFVFLIAGVVRDEKGQHEAVRALAQLKGTYARVRLIVAGDGATDELGHLARALGVDDAVEMLGFVSDLDAVYERSHALLMCSEREAFGRVTVEAMAKGLPVIGRASGGTVEIVDNAETGLLYDGGASELAGAMSRLIEGRELYERLSERALDKARREYSLELYASRMCGVFESVIESVGERV